MVRTERRRVPRMTVKGPAYVNLDPNNGGVILNISEGGLCFQSTAPIQRTETIRFWFSYRTHRIETDAGLASKDEVQTRGVSRFIEVGIEVAWTDQARKTGGLRFTNPPAEAREQIRDWIRKAPLIAMNEKTALSPHKSGFFGVQQSMTNAARRASVRLEALFSHIRSGRPWTGFSGGLLAGVLVSALAVTVFSLFTRSRELGDTLIRLGEQLGGRAWSQPISPQPQASSQVPRAISPGQVAPESSNSSAEPRTVAASSMQAPLQEKLVSTAKLSATKPDGVKLEAARPATPSLSVPSVKPPETPALSSTAGRPLSPGIAVAPASDSSINLLWTTAPEMELANRPDAHIEPRNVEGNGMRSEKYLEVGNFKEKLLAEKAAGTFSQMGFPASVIQRNRFGGKSYRVLVGPYGGDREAEAAHKDLVSLGFTPRSYERGRRDFRLPPALKVAGEQLPVGDCVITWESYTPDAIVKIEDARGMGVTVEGKWVKRAVRYTADAVGYQKNRDGSRTLVEIRFASMGQALVFGSN
jgi:cell division protein FtsN